MLRRATSWFADRGVTVARVLSDYGPTYRSRAWHDAPPQLGIKPKRTRPYRPHTNGKIERSNRIMVAPGGPSRRLFGQAPPYSSSSGGEFQ